MEVSCTIDDGPLFAKRALPLLNPEEYRNSIRDLFLFTSANAQVPEAYLVAPDANYVGSFPHTLRSQVSEDGSAKSPRSRSGKGAFASRSAGARPQ